MVFGDEKLSLANVLDLHRYIFANFGARTNENYNSAPP
jgi:hypothetical protein